ncbi:hypothetical protein NLC29_00325 [Candidatus Aminicenantes bacterium AH-873-B07]|jgi:hypothetical protein|nr:hypothetical protein [Candidatus Aminicenantes bacterium AH-873-B07]
MYVRYLAFIVISSLLFFNSCNKKQDIEKEIFTFQKDLEIGILEGNENYMFGAITDIDLDKNENIYVLDSKFSRIQKYNKEGKFLFSLEIKKGDAPGEVHFIGNMALTEDGNIWLLDLGRKVLIFNEKGNFLKSFKLHFGATHILSYNKNVVLLGSRKNHILHVFNSEGKIIKSFAMPFKIPSKYLSYKEILLFRSPIRADSSWDREIFLFSPYSYEIRVYKDYKIKKILKWKSEAFMPLLITKATRGIGIVFPYISVLKYKNKLFVTIRGLGQKAINHLDIFKSYRHVYSLKVEGFPYAIDREGRLYFAEEKEFPKVVRYIINKKSK